MKATTEPRLKRLFYRASHRGTREMDLILGNFVGQKLHDFSSEEIDFLEELMQQDDSDIASWLRDERHPVFEHHPLWRRLKDFSLS